MNDFDLTEALEEYTNPLDCAEEVLSAHQWSFDRANEDELYVQARGHYGAYKILLLWQEGYSALQFCCQYDIEIHPEAMDQAAIAIRDINSNLWLGHFDLPESTGMPCFRHTSLFRGVASAAGADQLENLIDIALAECERYHSTFSFLSKSSGTPNTMDEETLALAMMDPAGTS